MTRTPLSRSQGQRSTCRGRGHIVAASRTACYIMTSSVSVVENQWILVNRQVGQSEMSVIQDEDEVMNQLVVGAFFMHPDEGLSICKEWIQVCDWFLDITALFFIRPVFRITTRVSRYQKSWIFCSTRWRCR